MVLAIFIGGIFLGFSLGFATMAVVAARGCRFKGEGAAALENYLLCAYSPIREPIPPRRGRPQASGVLLTPEA
jgi:hypothetical protein